MRAKHLRGPLAALIAAAWLTAGAAAQNRPDFSGQWATEPDAVPAPVAGGAPGGGAPSPPPRGTMGSGWGSPITITQTATELVVEHQMFTRYDLQPPLRHVYKLDGSESQYSILISHTAQNRRARAAWKGQTLEITTTFPGADPANGKPFTVEITQRLTLESPTTLVVEVTRGGALGGSETNARTVYRKG
jgi:hypothetical protein